MREIERESASERASERKKTRESARERERGREKLGETLREAGERELVVRGAHGGTDSAIAIEMPLKFQAACLAMGLFVVVRTPAAHEQKAAANEQKAQIHSLKHELQAPGTGLCV